MYQVTVKKLVNTGGCLSTIDVKKGHLLDYPRQRVGMVIFVDDGLRLVTSPVVRMLGDGELFVQTTNTLYLVKIHGRVTVKIDRQVPRAGARARSR
jgi:hypothetical protein